MSQVTLFGKPSCSLCDKAKVVLENAGINYREVDITADSALKAELGWFIPVVEVGSARVFEAGMNPSELPDLVREALTLELGAPGAPG
ncbi:MAG: glutaredoxin family protein [Actinomycetota bacterium]